MLSAALGVAAACLYGAADFLGGLGTRRVNVMAVVFGAQFIGLLVMCAMLPWFPGDYSRGTLLFGAAAGICSAGGIALLYYALAIGQMGVVSPVTAVLAAVVPLTIGALRGERLSTMQWAGVALALAAVVMISARGVTRDANRKTTGIREAVCSGILLGCVYVFLAAGGPHAGFVPLAAARFVAVLLVLPAAIASRAYSGSGTRRAVAFVTSAGVLDAAANVLYVLAAYSGTIATAAVLTSLYPGSTALLARIVLNERLGAVQIAGAAAAIAAAALIAA